MRPYEDALFLSFPDIVWFCFWKSSNAPFEENWSLCLQGLDVFHIKIHGSIGTISQNDTESCSRLFDQYILRLVVCRCFLLVFNIPNRRWCPYRAGSVDSSIRYSEYGRAPVSDMNKFLCNSRFTGPKQIPHLILALEILQMIHSRTLLVYPWYSGEAYSQESPEDTYCTRSSGLKDQTVDHTLGLREYRDWLGNVFLERWQFNVIIFVDTKFVGELQHKAESVNVTWLRAIALTRHDQFELATQSILLQDWTDEHGSESVTLVHRNALGVVFH